MIRAECLIFLSMLAGGGVAAAVATIFLTLGRASKVSRCIFDFLTPLAVGVIYLVAGYLSSGGVFRFYALLAFLFGGWLFRLLYRRSLPYIKSIIRRLIVPIKSLENKVDARLEPLREKRRKRRALRAEKRREKRIVLEENRAKKRAERAAKCEAKRAKREKKRRADRERAKSRSRLKGRERSALTFPPIEQSH